MLKLCLLLYNLFVITLLWMNSLHSFNLFSLQQQIASLQLFCAISNRTFLSKNYKTRSLSLGTNAIRRYIKHQVNPDQNNNIYKDRNSLAKEFLNSLQQFAQRQNFGHLILKIRCIKRPLKDLFNSYNRNQQREYAHSILAYNDIVY